MKKIIRLTESDLNNIIKYSVNKILEGYKHLNGFDIPSNERKILADYDEDGFKLNNEPNSMWHGQFSYKADSLPSYIDYINKVNTDYNPIDKDMEIDKSWDEIDKKGRSLAHQEAHLDDDSLFKNDYRSLKPEKNIRTIRDLRK